MAMKKLISMILLVLLLCCFYNNTTAQCSLCTKTAQQLGEGPAQGLNAGILYLMAAPLVFIGVIGYRWWKTNR
jgi:hypothetical protein